MNDINNIYPKTPGPKMIKIIGRVGFPEDLSVLCEIPQKVLTGLKINQQGHIELLDTLELAQRLRRAYLQGLTIPETASAQSAHTVISGLKPESREFLYNMIFDERYAVPEKNKNKNNAEGKRSCQ